MKLNEAFPRTVRDGRRTYHFIAPWDTVLYLQEALACAELSPADKIRLCVRLTFGRRLWSIRKQERMLGLLMEILQGKPSAESSEQIMDFEQDAELIRSAFRQQYGIDLERERGRMSWFEFLEKLSALTDDTVFGRVIQIRTAKVPPANQHNREQRQALLQAKARVAIKKKANGSSQINDMWDMIAERLIQQAKKG